MVQVLRKTQDLQLFCTLNLYFIDVLIAIFVVCVNSLYNYPCLKIVKEATTLTSVLHYIGGKQIDIIYLDMSKAFNKVDHTKPLGRLHHYWQTSRLISFISTGTQATSYSSQSYFPRIAGYIRGTTRIPIRTDIVSAVCGRFTKRC